jgi:hypothetical protein
MVRTALILDLLLATAVGPLFYAGGPGCPVAGCPHMGQAAPGAPCGCGCHAPGNSHGPAWIGRAPAMPLAGGQENCRCGEARSATVALLELGRQGGARHTRSAAPESPVAVVALLPPGPLSLRRAGQACQRQSMFRAGSRGLLTALHILRC